MSKDISEVTIADFANSFGTTIDDIPEDCQKIIARTDFGYKLVSGVKRDEVILEILKRIDSDRQTIGSPERQLVWEKGWEENLKDFMINGYDLNKLIPKFIRPNQVLRFNQEYIIANNPTFELDYFSVLRLYLFRKYLQNIDSIYEFGCGTGFNLVVLAKMYPQKNLYGLDFVRSSVELVNKIGSVYQWKLKGRLFDMIYPDENLKIDHNSSIITIGALEQLAGKTEAFIQYILKQKPELCIHVEPTIELYDDNNLVDFLAVKFHKKRGYTESFLSRLKELELQQKVNLIKVKRTFFGSLFMEGYSIIIWKPI